MRKLPLFLLALSLAANVALLLRKSSQSDQRPHSPVAKAITSSAAHSSATVAHADTGLSSEDEASLQHARQLLATDDLPALVARLRAAGFSSMDIRGIVSARLAERYGAERVAATAHLEVVPYWQSNSSFPRDPATGAEVRRLFTEQNRMLTKLLGPDARATDEWSQMLHDREWGYLPADKVDRLNEILEDYKEIRQSVWSSVRGRPSPETQDKLKLIDNEQRADLEALFTPAELEAYEMRTSNEANKLKNELKAFQPTEAEYKLIYRLTAEATPEDKIVTSPGPGQFNDSLLQQKIRSALGPERAATYQMTTDHNFIQINQVAEIYDVPPAAVANAFNALMSFQQRALSISNDTSIPATMRADGISNLLRATESELKSQLGPEAYTIYRQQNSVVLNAFEQQAKSLRAQTD